MSNLIHCHISLLPRQGNVIFLGGPWDLCQGKPDPQDGPISPPLFQVSQKRPAPPNASRSPSAIASAELACRTVQVRVCSVCSVRGRTEQSHCSKAAEPNRPPVRFVFVSNRTITDPKKFCSRRTRTEQWSVRFEFVRDVRENIPNRKPQNI
jgi:hypothetical protein